MGAVVMASWFDTDFYAEDEARLDARLEAEAAAGVAAASVETCVRCGNGPVAPVDEVRDNLCDNNLCEVCLDYQAAIDRYYRELGTITNRARRSDQTAEVIGEPGVELAALEDALNNALIDVRILRGHVHLWGRGDDYCRICGADGRA
jgi:hypothetical protein